jgi:glycosyltransferase involved in cell wall biosynthesis
VTAGQAVEASMEKRLPVLSIVIPTLNEANNHCLKQTMPTLLAYCAKRKEVELIVVDSHSNDQWLSAYDQRLFQCYTTESVARGARLNLGVAKATGAMILLHHPRSILAPAALDHLIADAENKPPTFWGGFRLRHDSKHPLLRFISWYSNAVRLKRKHIVYLDHCIFMDRRLAEAVFPLPEVEIFEDTLLSYALRQQGPAYLHPDISTTSSIRFERRGPYRQFFLNQYLKYLFAAGVSDKKLNALYEGTSPLNVKVVQELASRESDPCA